jgi:predicted neuraminidase
VSLVLRYKKIRLQGISILKIAVSANGHQWKDICTLENHTDGEYSYPDVIRGSDGTIHISYTALRKK